MRFMVVNTPLVLAFATALDLPAVQFALNRNIAQKVC